MEWHSLEHHHYGAVSGKSMKRHDYHGMQTNIYGTFSGIGLSEIIQYYYYNTVYATILKLTYNDIVIL